LRYSRFIGCLGLRKSTPSNVDANDSAIPVAMPPPKKWKKT